MLDRRAGHVNRDGASVLSQRFRR